MYIITRNVTMMEGARYEVQGFTLIELMVVLSIIVIIATASVPKIQVWIARNRGNQAVSQLISDISKAKSISGYTVNDVSRRCKAIYRTETGNSYYVKKNKIFDHSENKYECWGMERCSSCRQFILKKFLSL
jgi:prepilin-type N-terminal cleavage/methylation domain-containing protein